MSETLRPVAETSLRSEAEIMSRWESGAQPLVSVSCITYNHEPYIRDAIEGFLMQETDFPFEVIIHDDASTDATASIVRKYAARYPKIIKPICQTENQYSQGNRPSAIARAACRGKYVALCEGDDYWTDPRKLQIQVDFLEAHPDVGVVHCDIDRVYEKTGKREVAVHRLSNSVHNDEPEGLFDRLITSQYRLFTCTVCARTDLVRQISEENPLEFQTARFAMGDAPLWLELSRLTRFHYIDQVLVTQRALRESASRTEDPMKALRFLQSARAMRAHYLAKYDRPEAVRRASLLRKDLFILQAAFKAREADAAREAFYAIRDERGHVKLSERFLYWGTKWGIARNAFLATRRFERFAKRAYRGLGIRKCRQMLAAAFRTCVGFC